MEIESDKSLGCLDESESEDLNLTALAYFCFSEAQNLSGERLQESFFSLVVTILLLESKNSDLLLKLGRLSFDYGCSSKALDFFYTSLAVIEGKNFSENKYINFEYRRLQYQNYFYIYLISKKLFALNLSVKYLSEAETCLLNSNLNSDLFLINFYKEKGEIYLSLYNESYEFYDLKMAEDSLIKSLEVSEGNIAEIHSFFGDVLAERALRFGKREVMQQALKHFSQAIFLSFRVNGNYEFCYSKYWFKYALNSKKLFEISYLECDFVFADDVFKNAIQVLSESFNLQLLWGELHLYWGWLKSDFLKIEFGLEKLTSFHGEVEDPVKLSGLLATGISMLGLYLEDTVLLKEGRNRLTNLLSSFPTNVDLLHSAGMAYLCSGIYFEDDDFFASAVAHFSSCNELEPRFLLARHRLYETYFSWGSLKKDSGLIKKSLKVISFLVSIRPSCSISHMFKGRSLLLLGKYDNLSDYIEFYFREAIDCFATAWCLENRSEILYYLGQAHLCLGKVTLEKEHYKKAITLLDSIDDLNFKKLSVAPSLLEALFEYGQSFFDKKSLSRVIDIATLMLKQDKHNETFWMFLGASLVVLSVCDFENTGFSLKSDEQSIRSYAEKILLKALSLGSIRACYWLSCLYSLENLLDKALYYLKKSLFEERFSFTVSKNPYLGNLLDSGDCRDFLSGFGFFDTNGNFRFS